MINNDTDILKHALGIINKDDEDMISKSLVCTMCNGNNNQNDLYNVYNRPKPIKFRTRVRRCNYRKDLNKISSILSCQKEINHVISKYLSDYDLFM